MSSTLLDSLKNAALVLFTPQCIDKYFIEGDYLNGPCFTATLSKLLGLLAITISIIVKIPQVLKIYNARSGKGVSIFSVSLDLLAMSIMLSYSYAKGYHFTAWGDAANLALQTLTIAVLVLYYEDSTAKALGYLLGYATLLFVLTGMTPINVLWSLQTFNIFIAISSKLTQAWANYKNGHTGQLSAVTFGLLVASSVARIITSIISGESMILLTYIVITTGNLIIALQIWYYWNAKVKSA